MAVLCFRSAVSLLPMLCPSRGSVQWQRVAHPAQLSIVMALGQTAIQYYKLWTVRNHRTPFFIVPSVSLTGRINHSGAPYQRKAGALFSYAYPGFSLSGCTFLLPQSWRPFSRHRTSTQRGKKLAFCHTDSFYLFRVRIGHDAILS